MIQPSRSRLLGHRRQRVAVLFVSGLADRKRVPLDGKSGARSRHLHHLDAFRHDFEANVVAEQNSNFHGQRPLNRSISCALVIRPP
jgi:hypothetical protein